MAENKQAAVTFRTQSALKQAFEEALEAQSQFGSATGFYEDAMRAFILAVRQKRQLAIPLEFLERESRPSSPATFGFTAAVESDTSAGI